MIERDAMPPLISNMPVKNEKPQTKIIRQLKSQVRALTMELIRANSHIGYLSSQRGISVKKFGRHVLPTTIDAKMLITNSTEKKNLAASQPTVFPMIGAGSMQSQMGMSNMRRKVQSTFDKSGSEFGPEVFYTVRRHVQEHLRT